MWHNCIRRTNNRFFMLLVKFSSSHTFNCLHGFPFANAQLGTNDKEARSHFQNGNETQLPGCVAPSDHSHFISSMMRARDCLAIHSKTWSKLEFLRCWRPSMIDSLQIWLIWGQRWVAKEHVTYVRHLDWVRGTWWCHWWVFLLHIKCSFGKYHALLDLQFRTGFSLGISLRAWEMLHLNTLQMMSI